MEENIWEDDFSDDELNFWRVQFAKADAQRNGKVRMLDFESLSLLGDIFANYRLLVESENPNTEVDVSLNTLLVDSLVLGTWSSALRFTSPGYLAQMLSSCVSMDISALTNGELQFEMEFLGVTKVIGRIDSETEDRK